MKIVLYMETKNNINGAKIYFKELNEIVLGNKRYETIIKYTPEFVQEIIGYDDEQNKEFIEYMGERMKTEFMVFLNNQ